MDDLVRALFGEARAERPTAASIARAAQPLRALRLLTDIRADLDAVEARLVDAARRDGESWTAIAKSLDVTRQAARRRHVAHDPQRRSPPRERPDRL